MNIVSSDPVILAMRADFAAAMEAFDSHAFKEMNIMANRILGNVVFGSESHRKYVLTGHLLKIVAINLDQIPAEGYDTNEIYQAAERVLNKLHETLRNPITHQEMWDVYVEYEARTRLLRSIPAERKAYKEANPQFTRLATTYIFEKALRDIDTMCRVDGGVVRSSLSELERAIRTYGFELTDLILYSLLMTFSWVFDYLYFEAMPPTGDFDSSGMKTKVEPFLEKLFETYKMIKDGGDPVELGGARLEEFTLEWRILFLGYYEISRPRLQQQRPRIELPQAARDQIAESVKRAMETDLTRAPGPTISREVKQ